MTAPVRLSPAARVDSARRQPATGRGPVSLPKVLDPRVFRARFAHHWAEFLRAHYRRPEEVAVAFGVRYQTACNWWNGANRPTGDVVALAGRAFADFMERRGG
jgi:hypothetical protein